MLRQRCSGDGSITVSSWWTLRSAAGPPKLKAEPAPGQANAGAPQGTAAGRQYNASYDALAALDQLFIAL
jgi:hypothetical protein